VERGDKVCLIYPTCAEFFYTFFGALRLGAIPVPLYPTLGVEGTANIFRDSEAKVVVTIGWFRQGVEEARAGAGHVRGILEPSDLETDAPLPALPTARDEDIAFIQTSSSTGIPARWSSATPTPARWSSWPSRPAHRDDTVVSLPPTTTWGSSAAPSAPPRPLPPAARFNPRLKPS
jgi:acyl-CoA synthetase (AMP-forming)/AMP-acid ligase II